MRYYVKSSGAIASSPSESIAVDVQDLPGGELSVQVGGRQVRADVVVLGRQLSIRVDGKVVDLTTEGTPPEIGVIARGYRTYVRVESDRQRAADAVKKGGRGSKDNVIAAPMPGRIVKILVEKGAVVAAGQPILVMEAMKMENEIKAKADCTIAEIHVASGAAIEAGAKLVTLAAAEKAASA